MPAQQFPKWVCRIVLACVCSQGLAAATDIATMPLDMKSSARPNIIFALDDSGSMDFEVLFDTNDGALWWEGNSKRFTDATGKPLFNTKGEPGNDGSGGYWYKFVYLFPNGVFEEARTLGEDATAHLAVPPIPAYAWVRSHEYNPLYYNPSITYLPWDPAYIGTAVKTFANATPAATRSHPVFPNAGVPITFDLTQTLSTTTTNWTFRAVSAMVIPGATIPGIQGRKNGAGTWQNITWNLTVPAGEWWNVNVPYYLATYYVKDAGCTSGADCFVGPDGAKLRRYEIKNGNTFPSGRTYAQELQNFANWFLYYRKRKLMLAGAMGDVLSKISGVRGGVVQLNNRTAVTMHDFSSTDDSKNGKALLGKIYSNPSSGGTPTREALNYIGQQYMRSDASAPIQYACQRNSAFVLTDGFANANAVTPPSYAGSSWAGKQPYTKVWPGTLSDIAASYYTNNLRSDMPAGLLSVDPSDTTPNADKNSNLHMNTYALALGGKGTIYGTGSPQAVNPYLNYPNWPDPNTNRSPTAIDDLWHATLNGRGAMFTATSPDSVVTALKKIISDMLVKSGSQSALAVSNVNLKSGDNTAYVASYNATNWTGDLSAYPISITTGNVDMSDQARLWSAREKLTAMDWATRKIATYNNGGVAFQWTKISGAQQAALNTPGMTDGQQVLNWLRGDRTQEGEGRPYRGRLYLMGDVVNAEPVVVGGAAGNYADTGYSSFVSSLESRTRMVYQASNDGMLHAIKTATGEGLWAYVPSFVIANLQKLSAEPYSHRYYVDATPTAGDVDFSNTDGGSGAKDWRTILVGGLGAGGPGFYALDVTAPEANTENTLAGKVLWEFPNTATAATVRNDVGLSFGRPVIAKTRAAGWVVLVTSGYNNTTGDGKGHLYVLNPRNGDLIKDIVTDAGGAADPAGLAQVSAWATGGAADTSTDFVYGGDLKGNVWRFDLSSDTTSGWSVARLATLTDAGGKAQPITSAPELTKVEGKRLIVVGTGRLLGESDLGVADKQTMYAIVDNQQASPLIANVRTDLKGKQVTVESGGVRAINGDKVDLSQFRGWYFDLPGTGERASTNSSIAFGAVIFTTNLPSAKACESQSFLYAVGQDSGGQFANNYFTTGAAWAGKSLGANMASRPIVVVTPDGRLRSLTHKSDNTIAGTPLPIGSSPKTKRQAWKEVIR